MGRKSIIAAFGMAVGFLAGTIGVAVGANPAAEVRAEAGDTVTVSIDSASGDSEGIKWTANKNGGSNDPAHYSDGLRLYVKNQFVISSNVGKDLYSVKLTATKNKTHLFENLSCNLGTWDVSSLTITDINSGSVTIQNNNTGSGNIAVSKITVTFVDTPDITASEIFAIGNDSFNAGYLFQENDFIVDVTKSDGSETTSDDYSVSVGTLNDGVYEEREPLVFGETTAKLGDNNIRFTSVYPTAEGSDDYPYFDLAITVVEPEINEIVISGDMLKKNYSVGESWDYSGLTVTGQPAGIDVTGKVTWSADPAEPASGVTAVTVIASYENLTQSFEINGIKMISLSSDVLTNSIVRPGDSTTSYKTWTFEAKDGSGTTYYGFTGASDDTLQFNDDSTHGIMNTTSVGTLVSIEVEWNSKTAKNRQLSIYCSETKFDSIEDYTSKGKPNGVIDNNEGQTSWTADGEYGYVIVCDEGSALYLDKITFTWAIAERDIVSLTLDGGLGRTDYLDNEQWSSEGLSATAHYSDGESADITSLADFVWYPESPAVGTESVSVYATYKGYQTDIYEFDVSVDKYVGPAYQFTVPEKSAPISRVGPVDLGDLGLIWDVSVECDDSSPSFGYDSSKGRGQSFGADISFVSLRSDIFGVGDKIAIKKIVVNASAAGSANAYLNVSIGNVPLSTDGNRLDGDATDYVFDCSDFGDIAGHIEIKINKSTGSSTTAYLKSITVYAEEVANGADIVDLAKKIESADVCASTTNFTELDEAYKEYADSSILNSIMIDDYSDGDTAHENGVVYNRCTVKDKADAIAMKANAPESIPGLFFGEGENDSLISIIAVGSLALITGFAGLYCLRRRRRAR